MKEEQVRPSISIGAAAVMQAGAVALLFLLFQTPVIRNRIKSPTRIYFPVLEFKPRLAPSGKIAGGGMHDPKPASHGQAPQFAAKVFTAPLVAVPRPQLPVVPTILAVTPQIVDDQYGDPVSKLLGNSGGPGNLGIGAGKNGGIGDEFGDSGPGGSGYSIGGDVSAPVLVAKVEPEYSDDARKAKFSGTVLLAITVGVDGLPRNLRVIRTLGLGLDEKAMEAVAKWRFRPGMRRGRAVATSAEVEVNFRLL